MENPAMERFETLKGFLESDPENPALLADVAAAAMDANEPALACDFLDRLNALEPLEGELANLAGLAAMRSGDQEKAQGWFEAVLRESPENQGIRFNLAWSRSLAGDFAGGAELLDETLVGELPQAAMLDMQIAHELGHFEEAETKMDAYLEMHPDYEPLNAAISVLAMDVDRPDLARRAALKGGAHPDALTTLGTLNLGEHKIEEAERQFETALATGRTNPRAVIGRGLVALAKGDHSKAAKSIDEGAEQFGDHLGSWIASGWAHLMAGDQAAAKARFQKALDLDDTFAEAHGSLAVIDIAEGRIDEGKRRAEIAGRLDPTGFSGALAKILLAQAAGDGERADMILKRAMGTSILPDGQTLEQAIVQALAGGR